jgi:hypothetical protein
MGYLKINAKENGDYIALRTQGIFSINFTNNSIFDGAEITVYKAFTKKNGEIGFEHKTSKVDGGGGYITYTEPQDASYQNATNGDWIIFELSNASTNTNIEIAVNIPYTLLDTVDLQAKNLRTNNLLIEAI